MSKTSSPSLSEIEPHLRTLLPADLYAAAWVDPSPDTLMRVFEHLRTLQRILYDYVPRQVTESPPEPGQLRHEWQEGTLMFTDLAGFTPLMEANAGRGAEGARTLLSILNRYFADMIEITSKSGGNLLEFTGDAMLIQFPPDKRQSDTDLAIRAGLRMQRAMAKFGNIETDQGVFSLGMRVGIHGGRFFTADIGTPRRMEHVLLGKTVQRTKNTEGAGIPGRVNVSEHSYERVSERFRWEDGTPGYKLVIDDLTEEELGSYDISPPSGRRLGSALLFDRSAKALVEEIERSVGLVEPLACFIPQPVQELLVENAARREIPPDLPTPTVVFINLIGLPESIDVARLSGEEDAVVSTFSHAFALMNAAVEARGGVLKKITYHLAGSDIMIFFGVPNAHTDDPVRAANAALAIQDIVRKLEVPTVSDEQVEITCQIGMARGAAFSAEIGEPRGRREFNVLGDTVNTSARLMGRAVGEKILITESVYEAIKDKFECKPMGAMPLKGKDTRIPIYWLVGPLGAEQPPEEQAPEAGTPEQDEERRLREERLSKIRKAVDLE